MTDPWAFLETPRKYPMHGRVSVEQRQWEALVAVVRAADQALDYYTVSSVANLRNALDHLRKTVGLA